MSAISSWADRKTQTQAQKYPFIKLNNGANRVRIVSGIGEYLCANVTLPKSKAAFGDRIRLSDSPDDPIRIHFPEAQIKTRHYFIAIDRATKSIGVLDTSSIIRDGLFAILDTKNDNNNNDVKVISPIDFDISIVKNPKAASPSLYYQVSAYDNSALSNDDLVLLSNFGSPDEALEQIVQPPTVDVVYKRLQYLGWVK